MATSTAITAIIGQLPPRQPLRHQPPRRQRSLVEDTFFVWVRSVNVLVCVSGSLTVAVLRIRDAYNPTARNREELAITVQQIGLDEGTNFTCLSNNSIFNQGVYFVCDPGPMEEIDRIPRAIRLFEALNISCLSGNVGRHSADVAMTNRSWNKEKAAFWFVLRLGACAMATRNASGQIISVDWQQEQDPQGERSQKFRCWCATFTMSNTCSRAKLPDCGKSFNLNLLISARDSTTWNGSLLDPLGPQ
ncbi:unnamed protein product [Symbiodinium microadriaticum]|nr:unnamed protein product [Symbiodinium microadriaticum]CAE7785470.1 unnamed protein product [Symbiodinium sp. KB8]